MEFKEFKRNMEALARKYSDPRGVKEVIIHNLIKELYNGYTNYGKEIEYFEEYYGSDAYRYMHIKENEYNLAGTIKKKRKDRVQLHKEWDKLVKEHGYRSMYGIYQFIMDVIELLNVNSSQEMIVTDVISSVCSKSMGIKSIDAENRRLFSLFNRTLKEDINNYSNERKRLKKKYPA